MRKWDADAARYSQLHGKNADLAMEAGRIAAKGKKHRDSAVLYSEAAEIYGKAHDSEGRLKAMSLQSWQTALTPGGLERALLIAEECERLCETASISELSSGAVYNVLGVAYIGCRAYPKASAAFIRARQNYKGKHWLMDAVVCQNLACAYFFQGDYEKALQFHESSADLYQKHGIDYYASQGYANAAYCYIMLKRHGMARAAYEKSLTAARQSGSQTEECQAHEALGLCYAAEGFQEKVAEHYRHASAVCSQMECQADNDLKDKLFQRPSLSITRCHEQAHEKKAEADAELSLTQERVIKSLGAGTTADVSNDASDSHPEDNTELLTGLHSPINRQEQQNEKKASIGNDVAALADAYYKVPSEEAEREDLPQSSHSEGEDGDLSFASTHEASESDSHSTASSVDMRNVDNQEELGVPSGEEEKYSKDKAVKDPYKSFERTDRGVQSPLPPHLQNSDEDMAIVGRLNGEMPQHRRSNSSRMTGREPTEEIDQGQPPARKQHPSDTGDLMNETYLEPKPGVNYFRGALADDSEDLNRKYQNDDHQPASTRSNVVNENAYEPIDVSGDETLDGLPKQGLQPAEAPYADDVSRAKEVRLPEKTITTSSTSWSSFKSKYCHIL